MTNLADIRKGDLVRVKALIRLGYVGPEHDEEVIHNPGREGVWNKKVFRKALIPSKKAVVLGWVRKSTGVLTNWNKSPVAEDVDLVSATNKSGRRLNIDVTHTLLVVEPIKGSADNRFNNLLTTRPEDVELLDWEMLDDS